MRWETAFSMEASGIKFGPGVTREVGHDMRQWGVRRVMVVTDPYLAESEPVAACSSRCGPRASRRCCSIRSGSSRRTSRSRRPSRSPPRGDSTAMSPSAGARASIRPRRPTCTPPIPPISSTMSMRRSVRGCPVPGRLKPLIAVPTTAGTGSETTGVAIFDYTPLHAKTGIAHRALRPVLGLIDPDNTRSLPPQVAACSGLDVLSHAVESLTALPFHRRPAPEHPGLRPAYQGSNPISDVWSARAIEMVARHLVRAMEDPSDDEARGQMLLAADLRRDRLRQRRGPLAPRDVVPGLGDGPRLRPRRLSRSAGR